MKKSQVLFKVRVRKSGHPGGYDDYAIVFGDEENLSQRQHQQEFMQRKTENLKVANQELKTDELLYIIIYMKKRKS